MDRKESLKTLLLGTASLPFFKSVNSKTKAASDQDSPPALSQPMQSRWQDWPDMKWTGPRFWGNRLQDWRISGGKVECAVSGPNRSLHCLTHQLSRDAGDVVMQVDLHLPLQSGDKTFFYEGTIAADPVSADQLKMAVFSCNSHYGFPNAEVVKSVEKHRPDMVMFLGDQIYESHGGFGVERTM